MSDDWFRIFPIDHLLLPAPSLSSRVVETVRSWLPHADEIEVVSGDGVTFIDAGSNFAAVSCPTCSEPLDDGWWAGEMDRAYQQSGFEILTTRCPVCGSTLSLNELAYDWPQGFASWCVDVRNPGVRDLAAEQINEIGKLLGHPVRVVYQHL